MAGHMNEKLKGHFAAIALSSGLPILEFGRGRQEKTKERQKFKIYDENGKLS